MLNKLHIDSRYRYDFIHNINSKTLNTTDWLIIDDFFWNAVINALVPWKNLPTINSEYLTEYNCGEYNFKVPESQNHFSTKLNTSQIGLSKLMSCIQDCNAHLLTGL